MTAIQVGKQRSQGMQFSAVGKVTDRLSIVSNYAYTDTLQTDPANPAVNGLPILGVPYNTANAWRRTTWCRTNAARSASAWGRSTWQAGGDVLQPDLHAPVFMLPSYTRWDAGLYYKQGRLDASAYFENIFDETYYTVRSASLRFSPGCAVHFRLRRSDIGSTRRSKAIHRLITTIAMSAFRFGSS